MYEYILLEKVNGIATITLNRPEFGNAFAIPEYNEVKDALEKCGADPEVRVVVITGAGRFFSAGGDVVKFREHIESGEFLKAENVRMAGAMSRAVLECPKPVIASVNGAAAGAGCALALACDFRVVTPKSKFGMAFINMGFCGDTGGIFFLNNMLGIAKTTELMAMGNLVGGEEAYRLGMATRLAEEGKLAEATAELAQTLANKPTQAIARQKKLYYEFFHRDIEEFNNREATYMYECGRTADHKEAVYAFLEKRAPKFTGQ